MRGMRETEHGAEEACVRAGGKTALEKGGLQSGIQTAAPDSLATFTESEALSRRGRRRKYLGCFQMGR